MTCENVSRASRYEEGWARGEWEVKPIGEVVTVKGGATPSTTIPEFWKGGTHCWATPKDMSRLSDPVLLDTERSGSLTNVQSLDSFW